MNANRKNRGLQDKGAEYFLQHMDVTSLKPLLFWIYSSVPAIYSYRYFVFFQSFCNSGLDRLDVQIPFDLKFQTDLISRVIVSEPFDNHIGLDFHTNSTLRETWLKYESLCTKYQLKYPYQKHDLLDIDNKTIENSALIKKAIPLIPIWKTEIKDTIELMILEIHLKLFQYLYQIRSSQAYEEISEGFMDVFRTFIIFALEKRYRYLFPDSHSEDYLIIKKKCKRYWNIKKDL